MKFLQQLGRSMLLPIAVLPICGIMMGLGYLLCPASMQGGNITGLVPYIGLFFVKAGGAIIDNIPLLFVIGIGFGMSVDNDGTAALSAIISWFVVTTLVSTSFVSTIMPNIIENERAILAYDKIANPFIAICCGLIGAACYNRFKGTKLPDALAFFGGKRCVSIFSGLFSILASAILILIWPIIFGLLITLGQSIAGLGNFGVGIYVFLNRLLIPTGLHHALNSVFLFDTIGLGDLSHFWAGETSNDVNWSLGMYMAGYFPSMMFGVPGAALAMIRCAKPGKRKVALGIMGSAAICSFICGVTEPFEFTFMFLAPALYLVYSLLYGIIAFITVSLGFRAGFSFSGGAVDLFFSSHLPAAANIALIIPIGIVTFIIYYLVFRFAIIKWRLKTPGREDLEEIATKKNNADVIPTDINISIPQISDSDNDITQDLSDSDRYKKMAEAFLSGVGGKDNLESITNCMTRLRLVVKDMALVHETAIRAAGAKGVVRPGRKALQIVVGPQVEHIAVEFNKLVQ